MNNDKVSNIFNESSLNSSPSSSQFDTTAILQALATNTNESDNSDTSLSGGSGSTKRYSITDKNNSSSNLVSPLFVGIKPKSTSATSTTTSSFSTVSQEESFTPTASSSSFNNLQKSPSQEFLHLQQQQQQQQQQSTGGGGGSGVLGIITNSIVSGFSRGGSSRNYKNQHHHPQSISMDTSINSVDDDIENLDMTSHNTQNASILFTSRNPKGIDDEEDEYDPSSPLNPKEFSRIYNQNLARHSTKRFVHHFPLWLEEKFRKFDDPIIKLCQRNTSKIFYYFSLFITSIVAIEIAIAMPFVLFILGQDALATEFTYLGLLLALLSQVPKRFLWRFRPYMVQRAKTCKKDQTSSFPSRAVTCSVVYSYAIIWTVLYYHPGPIFQWWMPFIFLVMILLSSFARINLGVHYPSDCVGGVIQGTLVCLIGTGLRSLDILGCKSCWDGGCYATGDTCSIGFGTLDRLNFIMLSILLLLCIFVPIVSVMKPVDFWSKCDRVYGMLFPAMVFQLLLLCPRSYSLAGSLPAPPRPHWYSYLFGISLSLLATIFASKAKLKHPLITFWVLFVVLSFSLFAWRISLLG